MMMNREITGIMNVFITEKGKEGELIGKGKGSGGVQE